MSSSPSPASSPSRRTNPGEAAIREVEFDSVYPTTFPSGQGSDLAGVVEELGDGVEGFSAGDEVIGFVNTRSAQAELVLLEAEDLTPKPQTVLWEEAGALFAAEMTAYAAVRTVSADEGDTLVVSGAAGGVGSLTVQLANAAGATA